jgi:hypothetical protein
MKLTVFFAFVCCIGFISHVIAGPGSAGVGTQIAPVDNAVVTPVKVPTDVAPGSNVRDSAAGSSDQFSQSSASSAGGSAQFGQATASSASANGSSASADGSSNASSTGQTASTNGLSNTNLLQNTNATSNVIRRGEEKMVETPDSELAAADAAAKSEKSEVTKKFEPSILNAGIDEIANSKASSKVPDFAPINPVTGETIPQRPASNAPPTNPIPSAAVSPLPKD